MSAESMAIATAVPVVEAEEVMAIEAAVQGSGKVAHSPSYTTLIESDLKSMKALASSCNTME